MVLLVGLMDVAIKRGGLAVAARFAKLDEGLIADQRDAFAGELPGGDARRRAFERAQEFKQWRVARLARVNVYRVNAHRREPFDDQPIMFGLVAALPRQRQLDVQLLRRAEP